MKRITYIIALAAMFAGCKKSLEEKSFTGIYTKDFYKNAGEAEAAITAAYGGLYVMYSAGAPLFMSDWSADQTFPRAVVGRNTIPTYAYDPAYSVQTSFGRANESPLEIWKTTYKMIESANWVIEKVPATPMDATRRNQIVGEAYFLRAFGHWMLSKNFGSIVLKTSATIGVENAFVGRKPIDEIYQQIFEDLGKAIDMLPDNSAALVKGRVSKQSAQLLLAKAALYNEKWSIALTNAQAVINSKKYSLVPSFTDLFTASKKDLARQEIAFAIELNPNTSPVRQSQTHYFYAPIGAVEYIKGGAGAGGIYVFSAFYNSFNAADKRKELLATSYVNAAGQTISQPNIDTRLATKDLVIMGKYKDPNSVGAFAANNLYLLRYADAFLIAAEAQARSAAPSAEAYGYVDSVRKRANLPALTRGLSQTAFVDSVLQERSWEFYGEGDRWYDLTRTNKFLTVIPTAVNADYPVRTPLPKHKYFPIPQLEINANAMLTQNDPWK